MRIACPSSAFSRSTFADACASIAGLGFADIDVAVAEERGHFRPSDLAHDHATAHLSLAHAASAAGVRPCVFSVDLGGVEISAAQDRLAAVCRLATACDVDIVSLQAEPAPHWDAACLQALLTVTQPRNIALSVAAEVGGDGEEILRRLEAVPGLALTAVVEAEAEGVSFREAWSKVVTAIVHVRLRFSGEAASGPHIPFLLSSLHDCGYAGNITAESVVTDADASGLIIAASRQSILALATAAGFAVTIGG